MSQYLSHYLKKHQKNPDLAAVAYLASLDLISKTAPTVSESIVQELIDQRTHLKMIASENFTSLAVQLAMGNLLTDKYAEGIPGHRFYAGCDNIDRIESEANALLCDIFGAEYAYSQPHSGADANLVAYWAILLKRVQSKELEKLGKDNLNELTPVEYEHLRQQLVNQKLMGMSLNSGGHLTHGYRHNVSSKMMHSVFYDVDPTTECIDYAAVAKKAHEERPAILLAGYSAHSKKINFAKMKEIADSVGATFMVDMAHFAGLVAGKVFTGEYNPIPYADVVTSTTHKTLRGPRGGFILSTKEYQPFIEKGCPLLLGGPLPHVIAAKCVSFHEAKQTSFKTYAHKIVENARVLSRELKQYGYRLVSNETENHMLIVDLSPLNLTGRHGEQALRRAGITCNRNAIPFDKNGPWYTSGVRLGTAALTTLGMQEEEMKEIAAIIHDCLSHVQPTPTESGYSLSNSTIPQNVIENSRARVKNLLEQYPLYPEIELCE